MTYLLDEIDANFDNFTRQWPAASASNFADLSSTAFFKQSYRRVTALQALKSFIVEPLFSPESASFFFEAHNDALVSHVNASVGSWRPALQSLRSCTENVLSALYYADHRVELQLWERGDHRLSFSDLLKYSRDIPNLRQLTSPLPG